MIRTIATLLTSHNRKDKTVNCLESLFEAKQSCLVNFEMDVYLTDDGSSDGTATYVHELFPQVRILQANGNLYWAGGMRNSWRKALETGNYDSFLLLNDDTEIEPNCFDELFETHKFSVKCYGTGAIYVCSVRDKITLEHTYGGSILINKWTYQLQSIIPDGKIKECNFGNSNIMLVHKDVVKKMGIFDNKYIHAKADYDYTLRAGKYNIPVLVCPYYCGFCTRDNKTPDLRKMTLKERIQYLKSPKGIEISEYLYFMRKFFPWRTPFVFCSLWLKTIMPSASLIINKILKR